MPLLFREAPVNSVWEGSGNVNALDLLRAMSRETGAVDALLAELGSAAGADHRYDAAVRELLNEFADLQHLEFRARRLAERIAVLLQAAQLLKFAPSELADAFVVTRVARDSGVQFGTMPRGVDIATILMRADPVDA